MFGKDLALHWVAREHSTGVYSPKPTLLLLIKGKKKGRYRVRPLSLALMDEERIVRKGSEARGTAVGSSCML